MAVQSAISPCPIAIGELPELLGSVPGAAEGGVPALLGGRLVDLPSQIPSYLPASTQREVVAVLAGQRGERARRTAGSVAADPSAAQALVMDGAACARLLGFLDHAGDVRDRRGVRYRMGYLLALPIVAMMAHQVDVSGIGEWIAGAPPALLLALGAPVDRAGVVRRPDTKTITAAMAVHGAAYDQALCAWVGALARQHHGRAVGRLRPALHVDGKAQKGAAVRGGRAPMLISARFDTGIVAAQREVPVGKTNEITVFAPLLDQISDAGLAGAVVTADQLHTQRGHATYLHRRRADYVFTVGGNQPNLYAALDALPWAQIAVEAATVDRGHGRIEIRTIKTLPATEKITGLFPHVKQAFLLERYIYDLDGKPLGAVAVLGITSLTGDQADGAALLAYVRGHWSIESLHWLRDHVLGEDDSRLKSAARAMAALRNTIISMCRLRGITRISHQLRQCGRDPYRRPLILLGLMRPASNPTAT